MIKINLASTKTCKNGLHKYPVAAERCTECRAKRKPQRAAYYAANKARIAEVRRAYREANKDAIAERKSRYYKDNKPQVYGKILKWKYGIDLEDYARMAHAQNRKCAACGTAVTLGVDTALDHCHATGKIRGILCAPCNKSLGLMQESPEKIRALASYIERFK